MEMNSIEGTVNQIRDLYDDAIDKLADVTVDAIYEDDNNGYEMAKYLCRLRNRKRIQNCK